MADNPETPQWESGIYQIETTDVVIGGVGGIANRPNVELGNRTAQIKAKLNQNGIYVIGAEHTFTGQNIDDSPNIEFLGTVVNGDVVYFNEGGAEYFKAIAPTNTPAGIADITNQRMISGGMLLHNSLPAGALAGDILYLSTSVAGQMTLTPTVTVVGKVLWKTGATSGIILVDMGGVGVINHSDLNQDEPQYHFTVGSILHSAITNDQPSIHTGLGDLIGLVQMYFGGNTPPANYLECNGALISKTTYASLYSGYPFSIGNRFGESGGSFRLPDFRGRVPRGYDHGVGRDPDRLSRYADAGGVTGDTPGSMQNDMYQYHAHSPSAGYGNFMSSSGNTHGDAGDSYGTFLLTGYSGGNETRMKNFGAMFVIRYQ